MNDLEIQKHKNEIDQLTRLQMASKIRFTESGTYAPFMHDELYKYFMDRFNSLGGWSSEISKALGWR